MAAEHLSLMRIAMTSDAKTMKKVLAAYTDKKK